MMVVDTSGKVAIGVVDSLKTNPLALSLVVMNLSLIGFVYMQSSQFNYSRRENVQLTVELQKEVQKLLAKCVVPAPQRD